MQPSVLQNVNKSPKAMESQGATAIWGRSVKKQELQYVDFDNFITAKFAEDPVDIYTIVKRVIAKKFCDLFISKVL